MINYIEKFLLVIFGIKKKPLCEEVCLLLRLCQNNYIGLAQLFPE